MRNLIAMHLLIAIALSPARGDEAVPYPDDDDPRDLVLLMVASTEDAQLQAALLEGMLDGLSGQQQVQPPARWTALYPKLQSSPNRRLRRAADQLAQVFGDDDAVQKALQIVSNKTAPLAARQEAFAALLARKQPALAGKLDTLLDEPKMRVQAIRAYAGLKDENAPPLLIVRMKDWRPNERRAVVETLASRRSYAKHLLDALRDGQLKKSEVPIYIARDLQNTLGESFTEVWGEIAAPAADKTQLIAAYKKKLTEEVIAAGNAANGRAVYEKSCAACHTLFGQGGKVGPDITGSNRADLDYILYQLLDPNDDVPDAYRMVNIETNDGEKLAGIVTAEDTGKVVMQTALERKLIATTDIASREVSPLSMMPEGLLTALKDDDVRDLILYLRSDKQVALPR